MLIIAGERLKGRSPYTVAAQRSGNADYRGGAIESANDA
jgi:hypothetical protein